MRIGLPLAQDRIIGPIDTTGPLDRYSSRLRCDVYWDQVALPGSTGPAEGRSANPCSIRAIDSNAHIAPDDAQPQTTRSMLSHGRLTANVPCQTIKALCSWRSKKTTHEAVKFNACNHPPATGDFGFNKRPTSRVGCIALLGGVLEVSSKMPSVFRLIYSKSQCRPRMSVALAQ